MPTTSAVDGSIRTTVSSPEFVTQTKRRPTKIPVGLEPTPIGPPTIAGDARSIRLTVLSLTLATHTSCLPSEIASGRSPTGTFAVGSDLARGLEALHGVRTRAREPHDALARDDPIRPRPGGQRLAR